jgi:galactokinase
MDPVALARHLPGADVELLQRYRFDLPEFLDFQARVASGALTPMSSLYRGVIEPPLPEDVPPVATGDGALYARGEEALAAGRVAVVVLAGGMATRFQGAPGLLLAPGEHVVKGTVPVLDDRSFLELKLEDARAVGRRYGKAIPFCIMGSFATFPGRNGIQQHLQDRGLDDDDVILFAQRISLRLTREGRVFGATGDGSPLPPEAYTTPGHGDFFRSIRESGVLASLRSRGVEVVLFSNVDNLGATVDPLVIGRFLSLRAQRGVGMLAETVQRVPDDGAKVGVVVRADGLLRVLEGFRIPDTVDQAALVDASINSFAFALDAIDRDIPLDLHAVEKKVDGAWAIQGETVTCEATGSRDPDGRPSLAFAAVRVAREGRPGRFYEGRFYPVKRPEDLDRVRQLLRVTRVSEAAVRLPAGGTGEPRCFWVPGRINLIGEHTDYNDGLVLPAAVDRGIAAFARARRDEEQALLSLQVPTAEWERYAHAAFAALAEHGITPPGIDLVLDSDLPSGSGMSSSAAVCLAVVAAGAALAGASLGPEELARIAQRAEHLVGTQCGIMDQWAITHGKRGHVLLLDCRSLRTEHVALQLGEHILVVADTGKSRELAASAYNRRREECAEAARQLGVPSLRDATAEGAEGLPEPLRSRALHVVGENDRVLRAVEALRRGEEGLADLGRLLDASHASLRDLFEVSCAELDAMVVLTRRHGGDAVLGARMMGGGFGGCTLALVRRSSFRDVAAAVERDYRKATGLVPAFYPVEAGDALREMGRRAVTAAAGAGDAGDRRASPAKSTPAGISAGDRRRAGRSPPGRYP